MTTSGLCAHPSGKRELSYLELVLLQGFPPDHFPKNSPVSKEKMKKMMGNAMPPVVEKVLCERILKHLESHDRIKGK